MLNFLHWFGANGMDFGIGARRDAAAWFAVTSSLSVLVGVGYLVIAVNWYFQTKVADKTHAAAALRRLRNICLCCAVGGTTFYLTDMPWLVWRFYDFCLAVFAFSAWSSIWRMRGPSLVDERLAQVTELEKSATRYREIAELLPHMVWTATAHGRVDFSNLRWREYAGDDRTWLDAVHPDERFRVLNAWNAAIAARQPVTFETRLGGTANGNGGNAGGPGEMFRTFVVTATPIVQGDAAKWLGACADVEDQKQLAAQKELQARQKSFFLNALSHDLRAPLHNVLLNAKLLKMSSAAGEPLDAEALDMIMENAVAAGDLVARLLDFAKVAAQEHNLLEHVSMPAMLHQVARRFLPLAEQKGLYLEVFGGEGDDGRMPYARRVQTDRQKLERIVSNLLDNAIKYTSHGGVTLELTTSAAATMPGDGAEGATEPDRDTTCVIRIRDTGIGIPEDKAPYLFDEFYQVNNYERDRSKGFGMGLAICRSLARHIGADVRLAETGLHGSCFEIVLGVGGVGGADARNDDRAGDNAGEAAAAESRVRADRGGRPLGAAGDRHDPAPAGIPCG